jgi:primosomal replication protein N''
MSTSLNAQTRQSLQALGQHLQRLLQDAQALDKDLPAWEHRHWFDSALFRQHSPLLADYVRETLQQWQQLVSQYDTAAVQNQRDEHYWRQRLQHLSSQISALTHAFQTAGIRRHADPKARARRKTADESSNPRGYQASHSSAEKKLASSFLQQLGGSVHAMYSKLSEFHQFERRLQDMVRQAQQDNTPSDHQLALHARLGRCRKAISQLEAEIQWLEQRR